MEPLPEERPLASYMYHLSDVSNSPWHIKSLFILFKTVFLTSVLSKDLLHFEIYRATKKTMNTKLFLEWSLCCEYQTQDQTTMKKTNCKNKIILTACGLVSNSQNFILTGWTFFLFICFCFFKSCLLYVFFRDSLIHVFSMWLKIAHNKCQQSFLLGK